MRRAKSRWERATRERTDTGWQLSSKQIGFSGRERGSLVLEVVGAIGLAAAEVIARIVLLALVVALAVLGGNPVQVILARWVHYLDPFCSYGLIWAMRTRPSPH